MFLTPSAATAAGGDQTYWWLYRISPAVPVPASGRREPVVAKRRVCFVGASFLLRVGSLVPRMETRFSTCVLAWLPAPALLFEGALLRVAAGCRF